MNIHHCTDMTLNYGGHFSDIFPANPLAEYWRN